MKKNVWVLLDNRMGSVGILQGIKLALDLEIFKVDEKYIEYNQLSELPNFLKFRSLIGITSKSKKEICKPFPDVVISASRRTATVSRYIKKKSKGKTKIIHFTHPGDYDLNDFDMIFLPDHDSYKKTNDKCFFTIGSPHRVTKQILETAKKEWSEEFKSLPKPLTALIIGGAIKEQPFSMENARKLAEKVKNFKNATGGSLLVTSSRRTGKEQEETILSLLKDTPMHSYLWGSEGLNPYLGYLACADNIIVTGDSVSMPCEACGTGKPVFIFSGVKWLTAKHYHFINNLYEKQYAVELSLNNLDFKPKSSLNDADTIAEKIKDFLV